MKKAMASTGLYTVGHTGEIIKIDGEEQLGSSKPECFEYKPKAINVRFGKFFILDSLKGSGNMSGSKSWPIHGIVGSLVPDDRTVEFVIDYEEIKDSMKCQDRCAGKINVMLKAIKVAT
ncbi:MAG: hypothetical protein C0174_05505, partial [Thermodesulfobium narugense]